MQFNDSGTIAGSSNLTYVSTRNELQSYNQSFKVNALGSVSGATSINLAAGNFVTATATGAVQWSVANTTGGSTYATIFVLELTNGGAGTQTELS